jgi:hypothetical protein
LGDAEVLDAIERGIPNVVEFIEDWVSVRNAAVTGPVDGALMDILDQWRARLARIAGRPSASEAILKATARSQNRLVIGAAVTLIESTGRDDIVMRICAPDTNGRVPVVLALARHRAAEKFVEFARGVSRSWPTSENLERLLAELSQPTASPETLQDQMPAAPPQWTVNVLDLPEWF